MNTRSLTEAELVGINDGLSQVLWERYFMESQGYPTHFTKLYKDNISTIFLGKNGQESSSICTSHIDLRDFFITDWVTNKEIEIIYYPPGNIIGDLMTQLLQGSKIQEI